jgi:uncharacterized surface protein with fasciclin (FAS1) repeats
MRVLCLLPLLASLAQAGNIFEELKDSGKFSTLLSYVANVNETETFISGGPFTLFAPTNEAFIAHVEKDKKENIAPPTLEQLKKAVLYHVVPGKFFSKDLQNDITVNSVEGFPIRVNIYNKTVTINGAVVKTADIEAGNGVIHIVGKLISPIPTSNIAQLVSTDPRFSTLLAAVSAAGLVDTLSGKGPFTVFAPTNDAFAKVPKATLDSLLADKDALTKVLLRHVAPGTIFQAGITDEEEHFTAGGSATPDDVITFSVDDQDAKSSSEESAESSEEEDNDVIKVKTVAGSAAIIAADILALNGVIHAIDTVV